MIPDVSDALVDVIHRPTPDHRALGESPLARAAGGPPHPPPEGHLALLAVEEHAHLRNRPLVEGIAGLVRAPLHCGSLPRHLWGDPDEAQQRLARVVQAFHTTPSCARPTSSRRSRTRSVPSVRLVGRHCDQRNQIWGALGRSGRLALFYTVDVAPVPVPPARGRRPGPRAPARLRGRVVTGLATTPPGCGTWSGCCTPRPVAASGPSAWTRALAVRLGRPPAGPGAVVTSRDGAARRRSRSLR